MDGVNCKSIYRLGMGNLTSLPGKKIDTFQFSYMKLLEKLDVARSQLSIFLSKKAETRNIGNPRKYTNAKFKNEGA